MIAWTRVHVISAVLIESYARHASTSPAKGEICVGHSPTWKKYRDTTRLNRVAQSLSNCVTAPSLLPGPTIPVGPPHANPHPPRGAPHGRPRGPVPMASCHASAPPAPRAGHPGSATWPQCRVAPRGGPARHVSARNFRSPRQHLQVKTPFFAIFLIKILNKNQKKGINFRNS